jgi:hypothetical protein
VGRGGDAEEAARPSRLALSTLRACAASCVHTSSVRGGKYSKEKKVLPSAEAAFILSTIFMAVQVESEVMARERSGPDETKRV